MAKAEDDVMRSLFSKAFAKASTDRQGNRVLGDGKAAPRRLSRRALAATDNNICTGFQEDPGTQASPTCLCNGPSYYSYPCCYDQGDNTMCTENFAATDGACVTKEAMYASCYDVGVDDYALVSPGCVLGESIDGESYSGVTVDECAQKCNEYGFDCQAFEYGVDHGVDDTYLPGDCILKTGTDYADCPNHNLDLYIKGDIAGYGACYTPGYVVDDNTCEGTGEDCSQAVSCNTAG